MPTSITVVATSTSAPPAAKAAIASCLARGRICPCMSTDPEVAQLAGRQALELGGGGARLERLGLLHQRADDERLAAGPQLLADALVGAGALALAASTRASGPAGAPRAARAATVASRSPYSVSRERARDRRGGHVQDVGRQARRAPWRPARRAGAPRSGAARRPPRPRGGRRPRRPRSARGSRPPARARRWPGCSSASGAAGGGRRPREQRRWAAPRPA